MVRAGGLGIAIATVACGPADVVRAPFADRCGEAAPVQLLELGPREVVPYPAFPGGWLFGEVVAPADDRWLVVVREYERETLPGELLGPDAPKVAASRVVSVDECGGDPREVGSGATWIRAPREAGEPWLACGGDPQPVRWFDPRGEHAEVGVEGIVLCPDRLVGGAIVALTDHKTTGREDLVRIELDEIGAQTTTVLLADVHDWSWGVEGAAGPATVIARGHDGVLRELDLATAGTTALREAVEGFHVSGAGRYLVWSPDTLRNRPGEWRLWDRQSDVESRLGLDAWPEVSVFLGDHEVSAIFVPETGEPFPPDGTQTELVLLPERVPLYGHGVWGPSRNVLADGTRFVSSPEGHNVIAPGSREPRLVWPGYDQVHWADPNGFYALSWVTWPRITNAQQAITRLAAPEFVPELLALDVYFPVHTADGRWITVRDRDADGFGTLVVLDENGDALPIDDHAYGSLPALNGAGSPAHELAVVDTTVAYVVRDPDGERSGVWIAELAPQ